MSPDLSKPGVLSKSKLFFSTKNIGFWSYFGLFWKETFPECSTSHYYSEVKRLREEKEFGNWSSKFYPVITSTASCQPEQSLELSEPNADRNDDDDD